MKFANAQKEQKCQFHCGHYNSASQQVVQAFGTLAKMQAFTLEKTSNASFIRGGKTSIVRIGLEFIETIE